MIFSPMWIGDQTQILIYSVPRCMNHRVKNCIKNIFFYFQKYKMTYRQLGNCSNVIRIPPPIPDLADISMEIRVQEKLCTNLSNPSTWGPSLWFLNHLGSIHAPEFIPSEKREKYWNFIDGLPEMLPCKKCSVHAREFVNKNAPLKNHICSTRDNLVRFFVHFHNSVNERTGKPKITTEEVYRMFSGPATIKHFSFE